MNHIKAPLRRLMILGLDGAIAVGALWSALLLRFEGAVPERWTEDLPATLLLLVVCRVACNTFFGLHRWSFLLSGLTDGARIAASGIAGTGLFLSGIFLLRLHGLPRSVVVLELLLSTAVMAVLRFAPRLAWMYRVDRRRARRKDSVRALIVGAGAAGEMLLRDLRRSDEHNYRVVGFVDDDRSKWGTIVGGQPILGAIGDLPELVKSHDVGKVLIAIPRLPAERIREILSLCADLKIRFKILPVSYVYLQEQETSVRLQDLSPEDLLPRPPVRFSASEDAAAIAGRTALVTGAAGSIGSEICDQLLQAGLGRLVMVDMNENGLYVLHRRFQRKYPQAALSTDVADVREAGRMLSLFAHHRPQDVFHAAAHKHVPLMEVAPGEAVKNNILGTRNVATAADTYGADRFVFISTDKAVRPTSVMGASKRVGEMLVRSLAASSTTRFTAVRFGNVLDSAGSVVPLFREQIADGGPVTVTHEDVRRYFMTIAEAVGLVLKAAYGDYGELCVLEMGEQIRIFDLARHMITMAGLAPEIDIPIQVIGLRPGEKLYEELMTEEEESTHRIDRKIFVAESPAPPPDLLEQVDWLARAALAEDRETTLALLRQLVPTYTPTALEDPPPEDELDDTAVSSPVH
ncbi:MAG: nucleoside-diphosphate sugar epimerase/dehydratase [Acidobacteriota bacterium]|nr:nucleoside-diphosphate sugar epimerase/dehydratase [Acidobacteriota bacterium]